MHCFGSAFSMEASCAQMGMHQSFDITMHCRWGLRSTNRMKGHAYPRKYYRCTVPHCLARKHTEISGGDEFQLVTTYVGIHIHPIPGAGDDGSKEGIDYSNRLPADGQARGTNHCALLLTCSASSKSCLPPCLTTWLSSILASQLAVTRSGH